MELIQLKYFVKVAQGKTLQQAADELHVSQSTLSISFKKLEQEYQTKLFVQEGRRLKLTEQGELFLRKAKQILEEVDALERSLRGYEEVRSKTVTVMTDVVDAAMEAYDIYSSLDRETHVNIVKGDHKQFRNCLLSQQADLVLSMHPLKDVMVESELLISEPMILLTSPKGRFAGDGPISIKELRDCTLVTTQKGDAIREMFDDFFSIANIYPAGILEVEEARALVISVANNLGVTLIPKYTFYQRVRLGRTFVKDTVVRPIQERFCYRNIYLSWLKDNSHSDAVCRFQQFLAEFMHKVTYLQRLPVAEDFSAATEEATG